MPISTKLYIELKFTISDYIQREDWRRLFEVCGTSDDDAARTIGVIFAIYEPRTVWKFIKYVAELSQEERVLHRNSVATLSYILGKMGQSDVKMTLALLRIILKENDSLRIPVQAALSNLWVMSPKETAQYVFDNWVLNNDGNKTLQELGVRSSEFLASKDPKSVANFLQKVSKLEEQKLPARIASEFVLNYISQKKPLVKKKHQRKLKKHKKRLKEKKKKRRKRK